jgi:hypothetical protein
MAILTSRPERHKIRWPPTGETDVTRQDGQEGRLSVAKIIDGKSAISEQLL